MPTSSRQVAGVTIMWGHPVDFFQHNSKGRCSTLPCFLYWYEQIIKKSTLN